MANAATPTPVVFQHHRHQPIFHGFPTEDHEAWQEHFEPVAAFNWWDDSDKLRHVFFALEDSARTSFENRGTTLTIWESFKGGFLQVFSSYTGRERAELILQTCGQQAYKRVIVCAVEMTRRFLRTDPTMPEEKKLRYLKRVVKDQLFAGRVRKPPTTIDEFISEATATDETLQMRARQYERPVSVLSVSPIEASRTNTCA